MRTSGVLLHPTSLPGGVVGTLGAPARAFVDWLAEAGQGIWQMLPIGPPGWGGSPYMAASAFAIHPGLLDAGDLQAGGRLGAGFAEATVEGPVDFGRVDRRVVDLLVAVRARFDPEEPEFVAFCARNASWLDDYGRFAVAVERSGGAPWTEWTTEIVDEDAVALVRYLQYLVDGQWRALRAYANARGVLLVGDIPIFVAHNSADVWADREIFDLDAGGRPEAVAGVPPDYFSPTGQRWGNPLYRWDELARTGYAWWVRRFAAAFAAFDLVRVDHFRGFEAYWRVPADAATAVDGVWVKGPGRALFESVAGGLGVAVDALPILVEDLGIITREVEELRDGLGLPGMSVLQFGFDGDPLNPHHPTNVRENAVVYTGTHDNDTTLGWWSTLDPSTRARVKTSLGCDDADPAGALMAAAWSTRARIAIAPLQDVLRLPAAARMNTPGRAAGNWGWRVSAGALSAQTAAPMKALTEAVARRPRGLGAATPSDLYGRLAGRPGASRG